MLAVPVCTKAGLKERVRRQRSGGCASLKIAKMTEMAFIGMAGIGKVEPGQRVLIVAVNRPVKICFRQAPKNAGTGKRFDMIVEMPLRGAGRRKCPVWNRLGRCRGEPVITYSVLPR